jgi:hypothetical protein
MKKVILGLTVIALVAFMPTLVGAGFNLKVTRLGGGQMQVLATNISGNIQGYCVWESSSNLVTWTPVVTNLVNKTWSTNTFTTTNSMRFYRAWVF